jgi:Ca2+/Na+ antiporter
MKMKTSDIIGHIILVVIFIGGFLSAVNVFGFWETAAIHILVALCILHTIFFTKTRGGRR